jgi:hypothetical protein
MRKIMRGTFLRLLALLFLISLCSSDIWAQATAQISGTVRDQTGAILPGVEITATQIETGVARTTITNETGIYVLPNLAVGPYRLEAALQGFRTYVQSGIVLQVNTNPVINPVLEVGQVTEQVEVQANAGLVETRTASIGQVVENERILELPLNGRQVTDLITLAGAAVSNGAIGDGFGGGTFIAIGGGFSYGADYTLDGANHRNFLTGAGMPIPFPEALQEFKVSAGGGNSDQGSNAGVSAVTKSGTNEIHGTLFEFVRNDLFNARNFFATKGSTLKRNQYGGTAGGPIARNKVFFFGGFQGTPLRQDPADLEAFIPTAAMMAGDWTAFTSANCNAGRAIALRTPFVNNRIDPSLYSRASVNLVNKLWGAGQPLNECGLVRYGARNIRDENQYVGRVDYQMNSEHSIFGRYMAVTVDIPSAFSFDEKQLLNSNSRAFDNLTQSVTLGDTWLIGPNTVNAARIAYNRHFSTVFGVTFFSACDLGIKVYCGYNPKRLGDFNVANTFRLGSTAAENGQYYNSDGFQFSNDLSLVRGSHQLSLGGNVVWGEYAQTNYFVTGGLYSFNNQNTGLAMGDFLLGRMASYRQQAPSEHLRRQWIPALYASDTWKATPKLAVNLGVRWEPYLPQKSINDRVYTFDLNRFLAGTKSKVFVNAPAGIYYPGDEGFIGQSGIEPNWWQFAPRVGLAYDLTGDGRTSVRASYGYSYNYVSGQWSLNVSNSAPWTSNSEIVGPTGGLDDPWQGTTDPFPFVLSSTVTFPPYALFNAVSPKNKTPQTSSWNLSIQRQISSEYLVSASYLGTATAHVWSPRAFNPAIYLPGASCVLNGVTWTPCSSTSNTNQRRLLSVLRPQEGRFVGAMAGLDDGGTMNYHALLLSAERRMSRGISSSVNYTLSHCIGDFTETNSNTPDSEFVYTDPNNRRFDRGNCDTDRRHIFNLTGIAETPAFANRTVRMLASNWRFAAIYRWSSGNPLNIISGTDVALNGVVNQRPNQVGNPYTGNSGPLESYLNASAFVRPATGSLGNVGRNSIVGPSTWTFDTALSRVFQVTERYRLEFRAQAYNLTNSFRPTNPVTNIGSGTFGQIRGSREPRIMEFAMKFVF